jgi:hypothetical protein
MFLACRLVRGFLNGICLIRKLISITAGRKIQRNIIELKSMAGLNTFFR